MAGNTRLPNQPAARQQVVQDLHASGGCQQQVASECSGGVVTP